MAADELRPLYRTMLLLGVVAIVILGAGLAEFAITQPFTHQSGVRARVDGVYRYDAATQEVSGRPTSTLTTDDQFAAVVDWSSLPPSMTVAARWYNALQMQVGGVGPAPAAGLPGRGVVPVKVPQGFTRNLPGQYTFVVERFSGGQPVELLARRMVLVKRADR